MLQYVERSDKSVVVLLQLWSCAAWYWSDAVEWSSIYAVEWSGVLSTLVLLIVVYSKMNVVSAIEAEVYLLLRGMVCLLLRYC
jgi:hypothetical protein